MASSQDEVLAVIKKIGIVVLLAALSGVASARDYCRIERTMGYSYRVCTADNGISRSSPAASQAILPAPAIAGLTLAVGGLLVLRTTRLRNRA
jgi:hypothetical protein